MILFIGLDVNATSWSAFVMKTHKSDTVQVESHHRLGLVVKVNGEVTIFDDLSVQPYEGHL